jgi:hypothetical protein
MNFSFVRVSAWKFKTKLETGIIRYDAVHRFHAIDVIAACGKCGRAAASRKMNKMLRGNRLFESDFVRISCGNKKAEITLVGFRSLLKLIMVLPKAWGTVETDATADGNRLPVPLHAGMSPFRLFLLDHCKFLILVQAMAAQRPSTPPDSAASCPATSSSTER